eukprot:2247657-Rhodomonas_salina.1
MSRQTRVLVELEHVVGVFEAAARGGGGVSAPSQRQGWTSQARFDDGGLKETLDARHDNERAVELALAGAEEAVARGELELAQLTAEVVFHIEELRGRQAEVLAEERRWREKVERLEGDLRLAVGEVWSGRGREEGLESYLQHMATTLREMEE